MENLKLKTNLPYGPKEMEVRLVVNNYADRNKLYLALWSLEDGYWEPYCDLTRCLDGEIPADCAYVDTNNLPSAEQFIVENRLGTFTHMVGRSGFCTYPLYHFDMERIRELI